MKANRDYINKLIQSVEEGDVMLEQLQKAIDAEFYTLESHHDEINSELEMDKSDVWEMFFAEQGFVIAEQELRNEVVRRFPYSEQIIRVCNVIVYQDEEGVKHLIKWRFDPRSKDYRDFDYEVLNKMERNRLHDLLNDKHFREIEYMLKNYFMQKCVIITDDFLNK